MLRYVIVLMGVTLITARPLTSQALGTECWNSGGVTRCNSQVGVLYSRSPFAEGLMAGVGFAQAWQQQAVVRDNLRASRERAAAAWRLYVRRVEMVVGAASDSLRIRGEGARRFTERITPSLVDLFKVNPVASKEQILEVLWPHIVKLNQEVGAFLVRVAPSLKPTVDSLKLSPDEMQLFLRALLPVAEDLYMAKPETTPQEFRQGVQPLIDRARIYFDSTRASIDSSARREPRP